nr:hypothetical protein GCM10025699_63760 [Microbacterium flavescens]
MFLVARTADGRAIACGGLRPLADAVAGPGSVEIKRMYVAPEARGRAWRPRCCVRSRRPPAISELGR